MNKKKVEEDIFSIFWKHRAPRSKDWVIRFKYKQYTRSSDDLLTFLKEELD